MNGKLLLLLASGLTVGCAGTPRILQVSTEPADATVCVKGRAGSKYLTNDKQCIGTTPYEADRMQITDLDGKKRWVNFKDIEGNKEQLYLLVSRPGYEPQALNIPGWEHKIKLKPELQAAAAPVAEEEDTGTLKITSNPVGALVYVNDYLKGNTPYSFEAKPGQVVRIKIEQTGYAAMEKSVTMDDSGKPMEVNLMLEAQKDARLPASASDSVASQK